MVVQEQYMKRDEQYPLLKVDSEAGDTCIPQQTMSGVMSPGWKIACVSKRSWLDRWPEIISVCWMTLILLGITLLVFYVLGMNAPRRQPVYIVKCNVSKPENNVYLHHIIPRKNYLTFSLYSDYLSSIAIEYPFLNINVIFLLDDSLHTPYGGIKPSFIFKRFGPSIFNDIIVPMSEKDKKELKTFQQRYGNVNFTVMPLSQYMALTPLKYKWKMIPIHYLLFYARVFTVWEYGGIGFDLTTFNNQYNNKELADPRITAILKQHNDGIEEKKYIQTINAINRERQWEFFNLFNNLMTTIINSTYTFFDFPQSSISTTTETNELVTLSRNYRNKRENIKIIFKNTTQSNFKGNEKILNDAAKKRNASNVETDLYSLVMNSTLLKVKDNSTTQKKVKKLNDADIKQHNETKISTEIPYLVLFYDFSVFSDAVGPSYNSFQEVRQPLSLRRSLSRDPVNKTNRTPHLLSMSFDGVFIAATSKHHPFLGHLLTTGCKNVNPKYAIENTMLTQCSGLVRDDVYCDDIFIFD